MWRFMPSVVHSQWTELLSWVAECHRSSPVWSSFLTFLTRYERQIFCYILESSKELWGYCFDECKLIQLNEIYVNWIIVIGDAETFGYISEAIWIYELGYMDIWVMILCFVKFKIEEGFYNSEKAVYKGFQLILLSESEFMLYES